MKQKQILMFKFQNVLDAWLRKPKYMNYQVILLSKSNKEAKWLLMFYFIYFFII